MHDETLICYSFLSSAEMTWMWSNDVGGCGGYVKYSRGYALAPKTCTHVGTQKGGIKDFLKEVENERMHFMKFM